MDTLYRPTVYLHIYIYIDVMSSPHYIGIVYTI